MSAKSSVQVRAESARSLVAPSPVRLHCDPPSRSPEFIRKSAMGYPGGLLAIATRMAKMVTLIGGFALGLYLDRAQGKEDTPEQARPRPLTFSASQALEADWRLHPFLRAARTEQSQVRFRAAQLRELLTELGPSFIKAGQVLANRPDIVRADYMNELCVLQDDVPAFPDAEAFRIIEDNLGRPLESAFSAISERPIAAASLGQVYKAVLKDTGEEVAIKVQRPGVEPTIVRDLFIFRLVARSAPRPCPSGASVAASACGCLGWCKWGFSHMQSATPLLGSSTRCPWRGSGATPS